MKKSAVMPLAEIARVLNVNRSLLSHYKKEGLLVPVVAFERSKYFAYDLNEVKSVLKEVEKYRKQGLTLKEVAARKHDNLRGRV